MAANGFDFDFEIGAMVAVAPLFDIGRMVAKATPLFSTNPYTCHNSIDNHFYFPPEFGAI